MQFQWFKIKTDSVKISLLLHRFYKLSNDLQLELEHRQPSTCRTRSRVRSNPRGKVRWPHLSTLFRQWQRWQLPELWRTLPSSCECRAQLRRQLWLKHRGRWQVDRLSIEMQCFRSNKNCWHCHLADIVLQSIGKRKAENDN